jgi:hypothetical protein
MWFFSSKMEAGSGKLTHTHHYVFLNILHLLFMASSYRFNSECLIIFYRRQAFWVAKQILQLGMGDTFDDWLVEKIQLLRKGRIVAFAVKRVEQVSGR